MELQLIEPVQRGLSVEDWIQGQVAGMDCRKRLQAVLSWATKAIDAEEALQAAVVDAWMLLEREEWWRAEYTSWQEFMQCCGLGDSIAELIKRRESTEALKRKFEAEAALAWGGSRELRDVLGDELMPKRVGKTFLEKMRMLSREVEAKVAREVLVYQRDRRLTMPGSIKDSALQPRDVDAALASIRSRKRRLIESGDMLNRDGKQDGGVGVLAMPIDMDGGVDGMQGQGGLAMPVDRDGRVDGMQGQGGLAMPIDRDRGHNGRQGRGGLARSVDRDGVDDGMQGQGGLAMPVDKDAMQDVVQGATRHDGHNDTVILENSRRPLVGFSTTEKNDHKIMCAMTMKL